LDLVPLHDDAAVALLATPAHEDDVTQATTLLNFMALDGVRLSSAGTQKYGSFSICDSSFDHPFF
jgi:hypothetical protein